MALQIQIFIRISYYGDQSIYSVKFTYMLDCAFVLSYFTLNNFFDNEWFVEDNALMLPLELVHG